MTDWFQTSVQIFLLQGSFTVFIIFAGFLHSVFDLSAINDLNTYLCDIEHKMKHPADQALAQYPELVQFLDGILDAMTFLKDKQVSKKN